MTTAIREAIRKQLMRDGIPTESIAYCLRDPSTWHETYGKESVVIVVHDGGDLAPYFNWDYCHYEAIERMRVALEKIGYYPEQCTSWFSAIYPIKVRKCPAAKRHVKDALKFLDQDYREDAIEALERALAVLKS